MGFDITGLNPKNLHLKEPTRPDNLYELSEEKQKEYFDKQDEYTSQSGTYFRNNVWWWRPLADYVLRFTKVIPENEHEHWGYNDCYEVSKQNAEMISQQLDHLIKSGHCKTYENQFEKNRKIIEKHNDLIEKELELFTKLVQKKMNDDSLVPRDFPKSDYKKWNKILNKRNSTGNYPFSVDNVKEFSEFCKNSGGFSIG
jgi:hypothetical protein|tara:strand:- start:336 stop:932 length:597 start_codon:yes stop_codon:yes gene_type:complete